MTSWIIRLAAAGFAFVVLLAAGGCEHGQRLLIPLVTKGDTASVYRLPPDGEAVVYLTIDDGPSELSADLLDLLAEFDVTATFFVHTDHITDPSILTRMISKGHNLGHHMPADRDWSTDSAEDYRQGFLKSHCVLASYADGYTGWYRPPQGTINHDTMDPVLAEASMGSEGRYMMASYLPWDAGGLTELSWKSGSTILARRYGGGLGDAARPGDIVLFHDGPRLQRTENSLISLRLFLQKAEKRGLTLRALPARTWSADMCAL